MKIHFIGIGTKAMCSLAVALKGQGYQVTGSDDDFLDHTKNELEKFRILGGEIGWYPDKITQSIDAIVVGTKVNLGNSELEKAKNIGLKIYSYPEFLYWLSKDKTRIMVAGSCGKYSIISMVLHVLDFHDRSIDFVIDTQPVSFDTTVKISKESDFILLEEHEFISSKIDSGLNFLLYKPNIALISNIGQDNINEFQKFVNSITAGGVIIYNQKDIEVVKIVENTNNYLRKIPYNMPNYEVVDDKVNLLTEVGKIPLLIFDMSNLQNVEASRHLCQQLGIMEEEFYEAIMSFNL